MKRIALLACASITVGACSTGVGRSTSETMRMTRVGMKEAVTAPLKDFNLIRQTVPPILVSAAEDPYKLPDSTDCPSLVGEIERLDLALGPDADMPRDADRPTIGRRASHAASDAALDAVRDVTTGWIPFRSTVRRLTGASHNQDQMEDAMQAGVVRRAYLKGLGLQQGCAYPAAPMPAPTKEQIAARSDKKKAPATVVASAAPAPMIAPEYLPPATTTVVQQTPPAPPVWTPASGPVQKIPPYDPPRVPGD